MEYLQHAIDILNWIAINVPWEGVLASGILSGILVGPQRLVKKWFKHNEIVIITFIGVLGPTLMFAWSYLLNTYPTAPQIVALQGLALAFATQPFYYLMVKPLTKKTQLWFAARVAEAALLNEAKATLVPPTGLAPAAPPPAQLELKGTALARSIDVLKFDR